MELDTFIISLGDYEAYKQGIITENLGNIFRNIKKNLPKALYLEALENGFVLQEIEEDAFAIHLVVKVETSKEELVELSQNSIFSLICAKF